MHSSASLRRVFVLAVLLAANDTVVHADQKALTLRQAITEALMASPLLQSPVTAQTLAEIRERQVASRFALRLTPTFQSGSDPIGAEQRTVGLGVSKRLPIGTNLQFGVYSFRYGNGGSELRDNGYAFTLSQPLARGFGPAASADRVDAARATVSAARAHTEAREELVVVVADAYFAVVRADRLVQAAQRSLDRALRLRTISDARSKVGLATELDVLRADLLAAQAESAVVDRQEALEGALDSLKRLLGRPPDGPLDLSELAGSAESRPSPESIVTALFATQPETQTSVDALVRSALASRLEVREARDRVADARRSEVVARWNLLPPVTLDLSYSRRGLGSSNDVFSRQFNGWRVGLSTGYTLNRSDESAAAAAAAVSVRAAEQTSADTEQRVIEDVRRAHRRWARTASTVEIQTKSLTLAERQLRLAHLRYERGVAGNFDVVDAETSLFEAQSSLIAVQVERALAWLALRRLSGALDVAQFR